MCTCKSPSRRNFLGSVALGAGGLALGSLVPRRLLGGTPLERRRFIFAYFEGGWDLLLGLDPRAPYEGIVARDQVDPAYEQLASVYRTRGVQTRDALKFGPAVPPTLLAHAAKLSIVNGIAMDTAAHEVGRRFFITGQFPRGTSAVGS